MRNPPSTISWRERALVRDVESVRALVAATGFFSTEEQELAAELVQERLEKGPPSGYEFIFAESGDRLLGYACYGRAACSVTSWELFWIAVAPAAQRSGLGRRILDRVERRMLDNGGLASYAETSGSELYAPTRAFYLRAGYQEVAVLPSFYRPGDAKHIFVKQLHPLASAAGSTSGAA